MSDDYDANVEVLRRASKQATVVSVVGAVLVFVSLGVGTYQLIQQRQELAKTKSAKESADRDLSDVRDQVELMEKERKAKAEELQAKVTELDGKHKELDDAKKTVSEMIEKSEKLKLELEKTQKALDDKKAELEATEKQLAVAREQTKNLIQSAERNESPPFLALVKPKATVRDLTSEEAAIYGKDYRRYDLWIELAEERKGSVKKVTYLRNHPSFPKPLLEGDPNNDFKAGYFGWGALTNVIIEITLKDGSTTQLDFNQYAAIYQTSGDK